MLSPTSVSDAGSDFFIGALSAYSAHILLEAAETWKHMKALIVHSSLQMESPL